MNKGVGGGPMSREKLIRELILEGYLKTPAIIEAFKNIDRADFVPETQRENVYENRALSIGHGQTISQPLVVAFMLELLQPKTGEKILDVGSGSGWAAALIAVLVGKEGRVVSIEKIPELAALAKKNIAACPEISKNAPIVVESDGSLGYPAEAPFDKIHAAAAAEKMPEVWKEQVRIGGSIVAPVGGSVVCLGKTGPNAFDRQEFSGFAFVPLIVDKQ